MLLIVGNSRAALDFEVEEGMLGYVQWESMKSQEGEG
jgi:hypothetical protein